MKIHLHYEYTVQAREVHPGISEHSLGVQYFSSSLKGPQALQVEKILGIRAGYQKTFGKNILKLEKIGYEYIFSAARLFTITSWDFFTDPPLRAGEMGNDVCQRESHTAPVRTSKVQSLRL